MKYLNYPGSGSIAGQTFSRNRFGQYTRTRAIPVNPSSSFQMAVRARLQTNAAGWRLLTALQREAWGTLGDLMTRTDSLGQTYSLTGFDAYVSINNNRVAAGDAIVSDPPLLTDPVALVSITPTATIATLSVAYTVTPLGAGVRAFVYCSPPRSAGKIFESDLRLIQVTAAAAASPVNVFTAYAARFGAPVVGQKIFVSVATYQTGFVGTPIVSSVIVA